MLVANSYAKPLLVKIDCNSELLSFLVRRHRPSVMISSVEHNFVAKDDETSMQSMRDWYKRGASKRKIGYIVPVARNFPTVNFLNANF